MQSAFRSPTVYEAGILRALLGAAIPGKEVLSQQLARVLVRGIDKDGSLELRPMGQVERYIGPRVPVEAEAEDRDGGLIHYLLHVVDGLIAELEVYKEDGSTPIESPAPDRLRVTHLPVPPHKSN